MKRRAAVAFAIFPTAMFAKYAIPYGQVTHGGIFARQGREKVNGSRSWSAERLR